MSPEIETWVAELDDRLVGLYKIAPNQAGPGRHVANGSYMVAPNARGAGVGRRLVEHSLHRLGELGYRAVQFNTVVEPNLAAIGLYESMGFATVGVVPDAFDHPSRGLVGLRIMHRFV